MLGRKPWVRWPPASSDMPSARWLPNLCRSVSHCSSVRSLTPLTPELGQLGQLDPVGQDRPEGDQVGVDAGVRLGVGVLGAEQLAGVLGGERLDGVDVLAAGVEAVPDGALGVLVGQPGAHGQQHGGRGVVLRGDQLERGALVGQLGAGGVGDPGLDGLDHRRARPGRPPRRWRSSRSGLAGGGCRSRGLLSSGTAQDRSRRGAIAARLAGQRCGSHAEMPAGLVAAAGDLVQGDAGGDAGVQRLDRRRSSGWRPWCRRPRGPAGTGRRPRCPPPAPAGPSASATSAMSASAVAVQPDQGTARRPRTRAGCGSGWSPGRSGAGPPRRPRSSRRPRSCRPSGAPGSARRGRRTRPRSG